MAKVTLETDGTRNLLVHFGTVNTRAYKVQASSESENIKDNRRKTSKTWNFEEDGVHYRVQIQATEVVVMGDDR